MRSGAQLLKFVYILAPGCLHSVWPACPLGFRLSTHKFVYTLCDLVQNAWPVGPKLPHLPNDRGNSSTYLINEIIHVKGLEQWYTVRIQQTLALMTIFITESPNEMAEEESSLFSSQGSALQCWSWGVWLPLFLSLPGATEMPVVPAHRWLQGTLAFTQKASLRSHRLLPRCGVPSAFRIYRTFLFPSLACQLIGAGWRSWVKRQSSLRSFSKTFGLEFKLKAFESFPLYRYRLRKEHKTKHKQGCWSNCAIIYLVAVLLPALWCYLLCSGPHEMCSIYKKYWKIFREACCVHTNPML